MGGFFFFCYGVGGVCWIYWFFSFICLLDWLGEIIKVKIRFGMGKLKYRSIFPRIFKN